VTQVRFSDRPENGFGHGAAKFLHKKGQAAKILVPSFEIISLYESLLQYLSVIFTFDVPFPRRVEAAEKLLSEEKYNHLKKEDRKKILEYFTVSGGEINSFGHHRLHSYIQSMLYRKKNVSTVREFYEKTEFQMNTLAVKYIHITEHGGFKAPQSYWLTSGGVSEALDNLLDQVGAKDFLDQLAKKDEKIALAISSGDK
jgi:hypothetical protein